MLTRRFLSQVPQLIIQEVYLFELKSNLFKNAYQKSLPSFLVLNESRLFLLSVVCLVTWGRIIFCNWIRLPLRVTGERPAFEQFSFIPTVLHTVLSQCRGTLDLVTKCEERLSSIFYMKESGIFWMNILPIRRYLANAFFVRSYKSTAMKSFQATYAILDTI